jgi:hypothetical protein
MAGHQHGTLWFGLIVPLHFALLCIFKGEFVTGNAIPRIVPSFCTHGVVGGVVILPSVSQLV